MGCPAPRREGDRPGRRPPVPCAHHGRDGTRRLRAGLRMVRRGYPRPGHAGPAAVAGAVTPFASPCPVCGATDEHAAWAGDVHGFQGATFCPHPRELGHGTGCCCGGRSRPWTAELIPDPARPLDIEERVAALEKCIRFPRRMYVPKWEPLTEVEEAEVRESARSEERRVG